MILDWVLTFADSSTTTAYQFQTIAHGASLQLNE
jgi:hypothetical protein